MGIPSWVFVRGRWVEGSPEREMPSEITIVTFNTWFDPLYRAERTGALIDLLSACDADVIALQEVTRPLLEVLTGVPWLRESYWFSDVGGTTFTQYGTLLLSRLPLEWLERHELESQMDRTLLVAYTSIGAVATVHLESLGYHTRTRYGQLKTIYEILESESNAIVMGDFNFAPTALEEELIAPPYFDLWPLLRPDEPGYTEDTAINAMRRQVWGKDKQVRFDRILLRSTRDDLRPREIELLGTDALSLEPPIFVSDHFGLRARISVEGGASAKTD